MSQPKAIAILFLACLAGFATWWAIGSLRDSNIYPGDKVETRQCRWCNGSGKDEDAESQERTGGVCPGCRGAKKVDVILPGPNHPVVIKGSVRDAALSDGLPYDEGPPNPLQPVKGAIPNAKIVFERGGKPVETQTATTGRFRLAVPPGTYKVSIKADGFPSLSEEFEVHPRREPIWLEKANLITEEKLADEMTPVFLLKR